VLYLGLPPSPVTSTEGLSTIKAVMDGL